ncbi:MmcQ/YjbR family DNA-binding protein [Luteolibacter sp. AS25]|uniref:MmcQ/YjbR family DNA-binding protein n=1 Tax=Luteolibacter sp. AS25 TaxID=3135776 RepID=UPI00398B5053
MDWLEQPAIYDLVSAPMTASRLSQLLHSFPHVEETTPFGPDALVQKVGGKLFAIYDPSGDPLRVNLKCDPDRSLELREKYDSIIPGYHMNKRHWNTLILDGTIPPDLVKELIQHSYYLVYRSLTRAVRKELEG